MWKRIISNVFKSKEAVEPGAVASVPAPEAAGLAGMKGAFARSIRIRQVDAGSCNACEWECTALTNPVYDIQRFGVDFVASPRHADVLLVTGPVSRQMELALRKTYLATPEPRLVVACGDCAIDGGIYRGSYAVADGVEGVLPVALRVPGCPPSPMAIMEALAGLMRALRA
ncbi:MAG: NADH-quinone oxidoreductase subunit B family protein [Thermodesulfovibrionales bacterium]